PVPCLAPAGLNGERTDPLDDDGRALRVPFTKHFTFLCHLSQKGQPFVNLTFAVGEMAHQEDPSIPVDIHFASAETGNLDADRATSCSFSDLIYNFLRKRVEHD